MSSVSSFSSPATFFRLLPDQSFHTRRQLAPARDRMLVTAFHSPATAAPFRTSIPGSIFPACYFASRPAGSSARSTFQLHYRNPVCPGSGGFSASGPLPNLRLVRLAALSDLHSPFGVLPPSGSKCSTRTAACQSAFRIRPISFRSPRPLSITRCFGYGSTFQVRYVSGGSLFKSEAKRS